jgi:hypothetical protein
VSAPQRPSREEAESFEVTAEGAEPELREPPEPEPQEPDFKELARAAAEADVDRAARASARAGAPLADLQDLAEASGDLLPPEPEPEPKLAPRETAWTRLSRAMLLLLLVSAASLAAGSYLLHQTLDPRPFLQDLMDLLLTP